MHSLILISILAGGEFFISKKTRPEGNSIIIKKAKKFLKASNDDFNDDWGMNDKKT